MFAMVAPLLLLAGAPDPPASLPDRDVAPLAGDLARFLPPDDSERDGRRTLGQLPRNLGRSFVGVFAKDNLVPLFAGTATALAASSLDGRTQSSLNGYAPRLSSAASSAGGTGVMLPVTVGLFAAGRFVENGRFRAFTYDATQALVVNTVYTSVLKQVTSRSRPDGSNTLSFPSGHTSSAFAVATTVNAHYGWKAGIPSYLAASAIGLSRITTNKHHLSDVVAGATLGFVTGRTVVRVNGEPRGRRTTFSVQPISDPSGSGVGVGASLSW
jgi:membrane-associated phospholipid phosphatase